MTMPVNSSTASTIIEIGVPSGFGGPSFQFVIVNTLWQALARWTIRLKSSDASVDKRLRLDFAKTPDWLRGRINGLGMAR